MAKAKEEEDKAGIRPRQGLCGAKAQEEGARKAPARKRPVARKKPAKKAAKKAAKEGRQESRQEEAGQGRPEKARKKSAKAAPKRPAKKSPAESAPKSQNAAPARGPPCQEGAVEESTLLAAGVANASQRPGRRAARPRRAAASEGAAQSGGGSLPAPWLPGRGSSPRVLSASRTPDEGAGTRPGEAEVGSESPGRAPAAAFRERFHRGLSTDTPAAAPHLRWGGRARQPAPPRDRSVSAWPGPRP